MFFVFVYIHICICFSVCIDVCNNVSMFKFVAMFTLIVAPTPHTERCRILRDGILACAKAAC